MKLSFLAALHYIIFFGLVFLLSQRKIVSEHKSSNTCGKKIFFEVEKIKQVSVSKENTAEMLGSELFFKY